MSEEINEFFREFKGIWMPKEIWFAKDINFQEKLLLAEIDSLDNKKGCIASNKYFAKFFNLSETQISVYISNLRKKGYIWEKGFDGRQRILHSNLRLVKGSLKENLKADFKKTLRQTSRKLKTDNKDNNKDDILAKTLSFPKSNQKVVHDLLMAKKREIRIIGWYAKQKNIDFWDVVGDTAEEKEKNAKKKLQDFIKKNIKTALQLAPFPEKDILDAHYLAKFYGEKNNFEWKLTTVYKYTEDIKK